MAAQGFKAGWRAQLQDGGQPGAAQHFVAACAQVVEREKLLGGARGGEADAAFSERRTGGGYRTLQQRLPIDSGAIRWQQAGDEATASDVAADQTARFQQFVGSGDGGAIQSKQTSQFASGWQFFPPCQYAGSDQFRKVLVQLNKRELPIQNACTSGNFLSPRPTSQLHPKLLDQHPARAVWFLIPGFPSVDRARDIPAYQPAG